jgi:glucosamine-6-phosphate deaminase
VHADRDALGAAAARHLASALRDAARGRDRLGMVFASAPSQVETLAALTAEPDLPWRHVTAFHLDEYLGLPADHSRSFAGFLREHVADRVPLAAAHYLDGEAEDPEGECARYGELLDAVGLDLGCVGVGENGHVAFNEPNDTDFADRRRVRIVELDDRSRRQQVNEGLFPALDAVPSRALTLTVPAILAARTIACVVPGASKAEAIRRMLTGEVSPACPASALRGHGAATLFLDEASAAGIAGAAEDR